MELYGLYFASLALFNAALAYHRSQQSQVEKSEEETLALPKDGASKEEAKRFKTTYFGVYVLVMAADWLQGPYMYTLYKDEKGLSESLTAALFTTGFIAAAVTASFVGSLADKHGRRLACLTFCVAYSVSCLSVLSNDLLMLFIGRALGGLSTTLLYSVFETWMIAEYHARGLSESLKLGDMFSSSVTLSGVVAILAGIVGEAVVGWTGTKIAPFMLAILCLGTAGAGIWNFWGENYGDAIAADPEMSSAAGFAGLQSTLLDKRILTLAMATTVFEGSMYLFVFFWSPALKSSRAISGVTELPPFGLIFSCFMSAMMMGSMIFSSIELRSERDTGRLLLSILALAAISLLLPVLASAEALAFWCFSLFEACVGLYFPTMSRLKSELVEDAVRGKVYGMMRLPLNVLVVLALGVTREGDAHRGMVFTFTSGLLLCAFFVVQKCLL
ncbi:Molybdate-anion transporter [Pseudocercospora fuligena]|uniref:Molybdate-anion transporter n=1 Tax=Pseudocercospora fuligena TaxID=685502 RepID=A0A8H6RJX8_9PEZI|nr:Molybdate-anion transporter [Pseudocercospora fuligena]